jgi:hypothetical protein
MRASTKSFALRAAAKAALSISAFSCGGATVTSPTEDAGKTSAAMDLDSGTTSTTMREDAEAPPTMRDAGNTVVATDDPCPGVPGGDAAVSENGFACCKSYLAPAAGAAFGSLGVDASAPFAAACCSAVIRYVDVTDGAYTAAEALLPGCCESQNPIPIGRACTPWGPPVPPAMPMGVA